MNYTGGAPARQPKTEVPESGVPGTSTASEDQRADRGMVAHLRLLWEQRRLLRRAVLCGVLTSTLIAFLIPKRYEATTQLMPPEGQPGAGMAMLAALSARSGGGALGGIAGDLLGVKNNGALFVGILQSRTVADRLIEQFQLRHVYHASKIEDARKVLAEHTSIREDRKSGILTITVTDHDPQRGAAIAQAYVRELDHLVAEVSTSSARRERVFLEERLRDVKRDLDAAAQKFSEFASKNTAIDIPAQGKAMVEAAATLQGQRIAAKSELRGLEQVYTDQNVRVRALRARVAELSQQLQKLGGSDSPAEVKNDNSLYPSIRKLPLLGATYADLHRRTKIQETVFELLTQQYELAKVQEVKEIPSVKVLDAPVVPTKKSFPPRLLLIVAGTLLAVVLTAGWVFLRQRWNEIDPNDPGRALAEEMATSLRTSTLRLVPAGATMRRGLSRISRSAPGDSRLVPVDSKTETMTEFSHRAESELG